MLVLPLTVRCANTLPRPDRSVHSTVYDPDGKTLDPQVGAGGAANAHADAITCLAVDRGQAPCLPQLGMCCPASKRRRGTACRQPHMQERLSPCPRTGAGRRAAALHLQRLHQGAAGGAGKQGGGSCWHVCCWEAGLLRVVCRSQPAFSQPAGCLLRPHISAIHAWTRSHSPLPVQLYLLTPAAGPWLPFCAGCAASEGHSGCGRSHRAVQPGAAAGLPRRAGHG